MLHLCYCVTRPILTIKVFCLPLYLYFFFRGKYGHRTWSILLLLLGQKALPLQITNLMRAGYSSAFCLYFYILQRSNLRTLSWKDDKTKRFRKFLKPIVLYSDCHILSSAEKMFSMSASHHFHIPIRCFSVYLVSKEKHTGCSCLYVIIPTFTLG